MSKELGNYWSYLAILLLYVITLFSHALGTFFALVLIGIMLVVYEISFKSKILFERLLKMSIIVVILSISYWVYTQVIIPVIAQGIKIETILMDLIQRLIAKEFPHDIIPYYAPGYSREEFKVYAIAWAAAPSFVAASFIILLLRKLLHKKGKLKNALITDSEPPEIVDTILSISFFGLVMFSIAYASYTIGYETGQYLLVLGSMASFVPAGYVIHNILKRHGRLGKIIVPILLSMLVFLGASSPTWDPLGHPSFEVSAKVHKAYSYIESNILANLIDKNVGKGNIYYDYDLLISGGVYKDIRKVIYNIIYNNHDYSEYAGKPYSIFIINYIRIRSTYILNKTLQNNVVYFSDHHICIISMPQ
jgi:hypothetical protein